MTNRVIRLPELAEMTGLSRATIYARMDPKSRSYDPTFPPKMKLGGRASGWLLDEVSSWISNLSPQS